MVRGAVLWIAVGLLLLAAPVWATDIRSANEVTVGPDEVVDDDLMAFGDRIRIEGKVDGDVIAFGSQVDVLGPVTGSVMAAGDKVTVSGDVTGSVRAAGDTIRLDGQVGRNVAAAANTVQLDPRGSIERDLYAAGQTLALDGSVKREAKLAGSRADLRGQVGRGVSFEGEDLSVLSGARVGGNLTYRTPRPALIDPGATVGGTVRHLPVKQRRWWAGLGALPAALLVVFYLAFLVTAYVTGVIGMAALPRVFVASGYAMYSRPWWNLLLGLLVLVLVPVVATTAMLTVIGLPLGLLALELWFFAVVFAGLPVGLFLGDLLLRKAGAPAPSPYLSLLLGLAVLVALLMIPILGTILRGFVLLFGLGVYARAAKGGMVELRRRPAAQPAV